MKLAPCPSCARHVRVDETACPFCRAAFAAPLVAVTRPARNVRVAAIALAAGLTAAGCVPGPPPGPDGGDPVDGGTGDVDAGGNQALYGGPPPDDAGGIAPPYGFPQVDDAGN